MPLEGVDSSPVSESPKALPHTIQDAVRLARRRRALVAFNQWLKGLALGENPDLHKIARENRLTPRMMFKVLRENPALEAEIFGSQLLEAKSLVQRGMSMAARVIGSDEYSPDVQIKWLNWASKMAGDFFSKKDAPSFLIANLVPQLPVSLREMKTVEAHPVGSTYSELVRGAE